MIHHVLSAAGCRSILGGNIGGSLLDHQEAHLENADAVVVELSSFMLHWLAATGAEFTPSVGVLTTLGVNHLDWHDSLEHYLASKRVLRDSVAGDRFIGPLDHEAVAEVMTREMAVDPWWVTPKDDPFLAPEARRVVLDALQLQLPGEHQKSNALNALRACSTHLECDPKNRVAVARDLAVHLTDFRGLPHRLSPVAEVRGIQVIVDSKATTPSATIRAVQALGDQARIHLIAGGFDKGSDLSRIDALGDRLGGLYAIGATAGSISSGRQAHECGTIDEAVRFAATRMSSGDVLLLSPGCASWDQFANYEHRGEVFLAAVVRCLD
jgi:UDP-N-acetylmuramoylalanine--D-glutamate ligase